MNPHDIAPVLLSQTGLAEGSLEAGNKKSPLSGRDAGEEAVELNYDPIPPRKTVTVAVRYRIRGRGQPLPYPLDEGDGQ